MSPVHGRATCTLILALAAAVACRGEPPALSELPPVPKRPAQYVVDGWKLRIRNNGPLSVRDLVVIFPQSKTTFGDLPVGTTREHQSVPGGVFKYAAFRYQRGGQFLSQPVIDWVGEVPFFNGFYTYEISVRQGDGLVLIIGIDRVVHDW